MSRVDLELILHTARLARLELSPEEAAALAPQFERTLAAFERLARLELAGVEPLTSPGEQVDVLRADEPRPGLDVEALLQRAPRREDGFFSVPLTVGGAP